MLKYFFDIQNKKQAKTVLIATTLACFVVALVFFSAGDFSYAADGVSPLEGLNKTANKADINVNKYHIK